MMDSCFLGVFCVCARSSNISNKRAVVSRQFCGPLSNTFPRWSKAGGTACRQRFALSILLACSHHQPNLSGVPEGMLCPLLNLLIQPLHPGMHSTCTCALKILPYCFTNKNNLCVLILPSTLLCITCNHSKEDQVGYFENNMNRITAKHKHFSFLAQVHSC